MAVKKNVVEMMEEKQPEFSKSQLLASARYAKRRDLVDALLAEDGKYTTSEVDEMIDKYLNRVEKGMVN